MQLACFNIPPSFQRWVRRNPYSVLPLLLVIALFTYHQTLVNPWAPVYHPPLQSGQDEPPTNAALHEVILVSAVYPISSASRYAAVDSKRSLEALLGAVATDVYLFVPPYLAPLAQSLRPTGLNLYLNTSFNIVSDIPVLHQYDGPKLREARPYLLSVAAHATRGGGRRLAFWVDADDVAALGTPIRSWPDAARFDEAFATTGVSEDAMFVSVDDAPASTLESWKPTEGPPRGSWIEGSFFGGSLSAVDWYARAYYTYRARWRDAKVLDDEVANALMLIHPDRFATVWNRDLNSPAARAPDDPTEGLLGYCRNPRLYYFFWFSREDEREHMNSVWRKERHWDFWRIRSPCRDTRAVSIRTVLRETFDGAWKPPNPLLRVPDESWI